jgi:high-affinity nickel-transport protein
LILVGYLQALTRFIQKLLFTAGMTLIDSADSILMLYSYSGFPERSFIIFSPKLECKAPVTTDLPPAGAEDPSAKEKGDLEVNISEGILHEEKTEQLDELPSEDPNGQLARNARVKMNVMSGLSIILTLMSVLVAFRLELPGSLHLFSPEP